METRHGESELPLGSGPPPASSGSGEPKRLGAPILVASLYGELRRLAAVYLGRRPPGHTLQPTALVHEAYLRLVRDRDPGWAGPRHFFGAAARAMREVLVDHARGKGSRKRGGDRSRIAVDVDQLPSPLPNVDLIALDEALKRLERADPETAEIVRLRCFAGLTVPEIARVLGVSASTIDRRWRSARALLAALMDGEEPDSRCGSS